MFDQLLSTLDNENPFFHAPLSLKNGELRNIKECHIVNGHGACWQSKLEIENELEKEETKYTAPWIFPHFSISLSYWDAKKEELQFILATYEKDFFEISDICSSQSLKDWKIIQSYIKKNGEKRKTNGEDFLFDHVFSILLEN
jgi:hypothetical protein